MAFLDRELIDGEKLIGFGIRKINQPDLVVNNLAVVSSLSLWERARVRV